MGLFDKINAVWQKVGLVQRGYSDEDIRKIIGENMLRVARAVLQTPCFG